MQTNNRSSTSLVGRTGLVVRLGIRLRLRCHCIWVILFGVVPIIAGINCAEAQQRVMVSVSKPDQVLVYRLEPDSGNLILENKMETSASPGSMCFNQSGNRLYVSFRNPGSIAAYNVGNGADFTLIGEVNTDAYGGYVSVHPSQEFLLSSYYAAGQVSVHRIRKDGMISKDPIQQIKTDDNAHAVVSDPSGKFLFVPHTRPNKIFQFRVDPTSGKLSSNEPPFLSRKANTGPRHLWFHPHLNVAYGSDEQGSSISSYTLNPESGTLSLVETVSSLPNGFAGGNSTSDIEVHPSGKFVYIANRGHNSIAVFAIDAADGGLTFLEHAAVDPVPRSFNITPKGDFLIAAGQQTSSLKVFRISHNGRLEEAQTISIEGDPWWVVSQPQ